MHGVLKQPLGKLFLKELLEVIFELVGHLTGVFLLEKFTNIDYEEATQELLALKRKDLNQIIDNPIKWYSLSFYKDNRKYYFPGFATLIGVIFWVVSITISILFYTHANSKFT